MHQLVLGEDVTADVELHLALMERQYISTACAAGRCEDCRQVDKFRALPCLCPVCGHVDLAQGSPAACGPLLHAARTVREERRGYTYPPGEELGVRDDLLQAHLRVMRMCSALVPRALHQEFAWRHAISGVMVFAPRHL
ncbi:hypothetical protein ABZ543_13190 [Streptomyces roseifaciens]